MPQDISLQNAVSHKSGLTFLQGFPFCSYDVLYSDKKCAPVSGWQSRLFFWAEEMPTFKTKDVLPVLYSSPMSKITHWRPGLAATPALKNKTPSGKAPRLRWASEELAEAAWIVQSLRAGTMPLYGATTVLFQPCNNVAAMVTCPSLYVPPRLTSPVWKNLQTHQLFIASSGNQGLSAPLPGNRILSQLRKRADLGLLACFLLCL